jgi:hypothetical protein
MVDIKTMLASADIWLDKRDLQVESPRRVRATIAPFHPLGAQLISNKTGDATMFCRYHSRFFAKGFGNSGAKQLENT